MPKNYARSMIERTLRGESPSRVWKSVLEDEGPVGDEDVPGESPESPQDEPEGHLDDEKTVADADFNPDASADADDFNKTHDSAAEVLEGDVVHHKAFGRCEVLATEGEMAVIKDSAGRTASVYRSTLTIEEEGPVGDEDVPGEDPQAKSPQAEPNGQNDADGPGDEDVVDQGTTAIERRRARR